MSATKRRGPKPAVLRVTIDAAEAIRRLVNAKPLKKAKAASRSRKRKRSRKDEEAA